MCIACLGGEVVANPDARDHSQNDTKKRLRTGYETRDHTRSQAHSAKPYENNKFAGERQEILCTTLTHVSQILPIAPNRAFRNPEQEAGAILKADPRMASPSHPATVAATRIQRLLGVDAATNPRIYEQVYAAAGISSVHYWLELFFSAGIATFGLVLNSPAVIIGAMLISPLMGPIMSTGLALAAGDLYLGIKALSNLLVSIALAIGLSALIVWLLPFHSPTQEVLSRTTPNLLDLGIALFSGLAGSVAVCRAGGSDGVTTLPGVAIAVALMPPLCAMGFGLGAGANMTIMGGAGLLFLTNIVAIVASAFAVFLLIGMNARSVRAQMEHYREGEAFARRISRGRFGRLLISGGQLRWRVVMLIVLLGSIAVPLRTALHQVAGEAVARSTVDAVTRKLLPRDDVVSQTTEVGRHTIAVRIISTSQVAQARLQQAESEIAKRTGMQTAISLSTIASQSELAKLMERLPQPQAATLPPPPPAPPSLAEMQQQLQSLVASKLDALWPAQAPLQDFSVALQPARTVVTVHYQSPHPLDAVALSIVQTQLQKQLQVPDLTLTAVRVPTPRKRAR
jgi:uncharacterized hydrophobic protein (TIGR00271 family)